jgi:hypothetical protein
MFMFIYLFLCVSSHVPDLLQIFQDLIHQREPHDVIIPKSVYDQTDIDSMISIGKIYTHENRSNSSVK